VGIDERWREGVRVIFRKRSALENHDLRTGIDPRVAEALA